jgi:hypothetical protein
MKRTARVPIRLKVMISLLSGITVVVSVITFTMAHFFHEDKRSYMNDWISIATRSTAAECRSLLQGYAEQLELASLLILNPGLYDAQKDGMLRQVFENLPELVDIALPTAPIIRFRPSSCSGGRSTCGIPRSRRSCPASPWPSASRSRRARSR